MKTVRSVLKCSDIMKTVPSVIKGTDGIMKNKQAFKHDNSIVFGEVSL